MTGGPFDCYPPGWLPRDLPMPPYRFQPLENGSGGAIQGCICPPGAEATCKGAMCPRRPIGPAI